MNKIQKYTYLQIYEFFKANKDYLNTKVRLEILKTPKTSLNMMP